MLKTSCRLLVSGTWPVWSDRNEFGPIFNGQNFGDQEVQLWPLYNTLLEFLGEISALYASQQPSGSPWFARPLEVNSLASTPSCFEPAKFPQLFGSCNTEVFFSTWISWRRKPPLPAAAELEKPTQVQWDRGPWPNCQSDLRKSPSWPATCGSELRWLQRSVERDVTGRCIFNMYRINL